MDKSPDELTPQALSQTVTFTLAKDSRTITISIRYSHPQKAKDIADTMAEVVGGHYQVLNEAEILQSQAIIDEQFDLARASPVEAQKNLESFKETGDVDSLRIQILSRFSEEIRLAREYSKITVSLVEQEAGLARAEEELKKQDRFYLLSKSIVEDIAYRGLLDKLSKNDIALLQEVRTESQQINPVYLNLEQTVVNARVSIAAAEAKEVLLKERIEENKIALNKGVVKLLAAAKTRQLKTVATAAVPSRPIEPNTKQILLIAAVVGLLAVLFLAFFLEYIGRMRKLEAESGKQKN